MLDMISEYIVFVAKRVNVQVTSVFYSRRDIKQEENLVYVQSSFHFR